MRIKRIKVENYKQIVAKEVEFDSGLNFIIGPNEAGKSSLLSALFDVLYRDPKTSSRKYFDQVLRWGQKMKPKLEMVFEDNLVEYRIVKDFNSGEVILDSKNQKLDNILDVENFLIKEIGLPTSEIYQNTGYVGQEEISNITKNESLLSVIQAAVSQNADRLQIDKILKELGTELQNLLRGYKTYSKNPGLKKLYEQQRDSLSEELKAILTVRQNIGQLKSKLENSQNEKNSYGEKIETYTTLISNHEKFKQGKTKISELDREIKKIQSDISSIKEIEEKIQSLERAKRRTNEKFANIDVQAVVSQIQDIEREQTEYANRLNFLKSNETSISFGLMQFVAVILLPVSIWLMFISTPFTIIGGVIGILFSVIFLGQYSVGAINTAKARNSLSELENLIGMLEDQKLKILEPTGLGSIEKVLEERESIQEIEREIKTNYQLIAGLSRGEELKAIEERRDELLTSRRDIELTHLSKFDGNPEMSSEEYTRKKIDLDKFNKESERIIREIIELEKEIDIGEIPDEKLFSKQIALEEIERDIISVNQEIEVLELTREYIRRAVDDRIAVASGVIKKYIHEYIGFLTNDKYSKIKLDEKLNLSILIPETDEWKNPDIYLSTGTKDLINLLARIAFFDIVNLSAPLIMDDPFVSFDKQRQGKVFEMLLDLSKKRQIIVISHNNEYKKFSHGNFIGID
jgi:DNA repair exonuclease SbcCD ATPase subunit